MVFIFKEAKKQAILSAAKVYNVAFQYGDDEQYRQAGEYLHEIVEAENQSELDTIFNAYQPVLLKMAYDAEEQVNVMARVAGENEIIQ